MGDYDSLRDLSIKQGDHLSAGRENELLRRVARMRGESAPGRRATAAGGGSDLTLETTAAGITVSVSGGNVFWNDDILAVAGVTINAASALKAWLALDDATAPTSCTISNGASFPAEASPPTTKYFHLAEVVSDGTTATVSKVWNGGDVIWPTLAGVTTSAGYWS